MDTVLMCTELMGIILEWGPPGSEEVSSDESCSYRLFPFHLEVSWQCLASGLLFIQAFFFPFFFLKKKAWQLLCVTVTFPSSCLTCIRCTVAHYPESWWCEAGLLFLKRHAGRNGSRLETNIRKSFLKSATFVISKRKIIYFGYVGVRWYYWSWWSIMVLLFLT